MDNVGLMAIVDAGEDLLHENGTVTFAKFATLQNLIEELTTLADSTKFEFKSGMLKESFIDTYSVTR